MEVYAHETFGPLVSLYRVQDEEEAIAWAKDSEYGLNFSVWTSDEKHGYRVAARLEAGTVNVNDAHAAAWGSMQTRSRAEERMQTVLGANGQIAEELTRYLHDNVTHDIRLVSRHPSKIHETDQLAKANLMDAAATAAAVEGSDIAYLTVGLPIDSTLWEQQFPVIMANTIAACQEHDTKLVFFDNTYMYPRTDTPQLEDTRFEPAGRKATVRAQIANMLLQEMDAGTIQAVICRAPEFYGPDKTKSLTNSAVFDRIKQGKRPIVPVSAHTRRTLIWTPDASRGMGVIGNTPDAYGQTWHLPVDPERLTYDDMIAIAGQVTGNDIRYTTVPAVAFKLGGLFNQSVKEASELLPRYRADNIFDSSKFAAHFPDFTVTTYRQGITEILRDSNHASREPDIPHT